MDIVKNVAAVSVNSRALEFYLAGLDKTLHKFAADHELEGAVDFAPS